MGGRVGDPPWETRFVSMFGWVTAPPFLWGWGWATFFMMWPTKATNSWSVPLSKSSSYTTVIASYSFSFFVISIS